MSTCITARPVARAIHDALGLSRAGQSVEQGGHTRGQVAFFEAGAEVGIVRLVEAAAQGGQLPVESFREEEMAFGDFLGLDEVFVRRLFLEEFDVLAEEEFFPLFRQSEHRFVEKAGCGHFYKAAFLQHVLFLLELLALLYGS